MSERLARLNDSLARKLAQRAEFDRVIAEAETAYTKILESSQILLTVLKKEAPVISKASDKPDAGAAGGQAASKPAKSKQRETNS